MRRDRFEDLAEAYGGDVTRWPAGEREAAALLMAREPAFTSAALERAGALDAVLDGWARSPPASALRERIVASAPMRAVRSQRGSWLFPAGLGAGLAAACAAGVVVGVQLSQNLPSGSETGVVAELDVSGLGEDAG